MLYQDTLNPTLPMNHKVMHKQGLIVNQSLNTVNQLHILLPKYKIIQGSSVNLFKNPTI